MRQSTTADPLHVLPAVSTARLRVLRDGEGWSIIPGRYGQIEPVSVGVLAVFTTHPRLFRRLLAVPGVGRWQTGDTEARMLFPSEALPQVARLIGARRRRPPSPGRSAAVMATLRATSRAKKAPIPLGDAR
jgi:hypothetical protein